jgi:hypothetical protein
MPEIELTLRWTGPVRTTCIRMPVAGAGISKRLRMRRIDTEQPSNVKRASYEKHDKGTKKNGVYAELP